MNLPSIVMANTLRHKAKRSHDYTLSLDSAPKSEEGDTEVVSIRKEMTGLGMESS